MMFAELQALTRVFMLTAKHAQILFMGLYK